jgi:hypothetical protein
MMTKTSCHAGVMMNHKSQPGNMSNQLSPPARNHKSISRLCLSIDLGMFYQRAQICSHTETTVTLSRKSNRRCSRWGNRCARRSETPRDKEGAQLLVWYAGQPTLLSRQTNTEFAINLLLNQLTYMLRQTTTLLVWIVCYVLNNKPYYHRTTYY